VLVVVWPVWLAPLHPFPPHAPKGHVPAADTLVDSVNCIHLHPPPLRAFVGRSFAKSVDEAKYAFFSDDLPQEDAVK
jgi:hypothetical protein